MTKDISYATGMIISQNILRMGIGELDSAELTQGILDVLQGATTRMTIGQAQQILQAHIQQQQEDAGKAAREAGEKFLADNAKREGVVVLPSGLQYQVLRPAIGQKPTAADSVRCHYEGRLIDGAVFDSSYRRREPATFPLRGVIKGWTEGLQYMAVGSKFRFFIPYQLGYGAQGAGGSIPPYAALIFDVELLGIND